MLKQREVKQITTTKDTGWSAAATEGNGYFVWKHHFSGPLNYHHIVHTIISYYFSSLARHLLFLTGLTFSISEDDHQSGKIPVIVFHFHSTPQSHQPPGRRRSAGNSKAAIRFTCFLFPPTDKTVQSTVVMYYTSAEQECSKDQYK